MISGLFEGVKQEFFTDTKELTVGYGNCVKYECSGEVASGFPSFLANKDAHTVGVLIRAFRVGSLRQICYRLQVWFTLCFVFLFWPEGVHQHQRRFEI